MSEGVIVAVIGAAAAALGSILSYLASRLTKTLESIDGRISRVEGKIDNLAEGQTQIRERLARMEGQRDHPNPVGAAP